jgi:hypothetical protein
MRHIHMDKRTWERTIYIPLCRANRRTDSSLLQTVQLQGFQGITRELERLTPKVWEINADLFNLKGKAQSRCIINVWQANKEKVIEACDVVVSCFTFVQANVRERTEYRCSIVLYSLWMRYWYILNMSVCLLNLVADLWVAKMFHIFYI